MKPGHQTEKRTEAPNKKPPHPRVAVIEIGSTDIDLVIARIGEGGRIDILDKRRQSTGLGRDIFTKGTMRRQTIEESVATIGGFANVMHHYAIADPAHVRIIASSALNEAANRDVFLDRVFIGTSMTVQVVDVIDAARFAYISSLRTCCCPAGNKAA